ncbi:MAG TPA: hypothetical protein VL356_13835 [Acidocella sp.]|jgi:hypothetical protein|nr:hypothetical protein [Acidocella sp.]
MKRHLIGAALAAAILLSGTGHAQERVGAPPVTMNDAMGQFWGLEASPQPDGGLAIVTVPGLAGTVTQTGNTVTTAGTFQTALAAGTSRHGCFVQNTSAGAEYVTVASPATEAASRQLAAGQVYQCVGQAVEITSAAAGAAYEVESW